MRHAGAKRIVVGMSGGVDSSVAALLLRDAGHQVHGVTMKIYAGKPAEGPVADSCYGPGEQSDIEEAARICARLGIPHTVVDLCDEYRRLVLDYARDEYLSGRTPNPCVLCNGRVKFGLLLDRLANTEGVAFDLFATGHYCRIAEVPETGIRPSASARTSPSGSPRRLAIRAAEDPRKDQSYFLCMLTQEQLSRVIFPLGGMKKPEVREIARAAGLSNHDRPESQDFAAGGYKAIVSQSDKAGPITDTAGKVIGEHKGVWGYTVGQRKGLGVGGGEPLYVTRIDAGTNTVVAGPESSLFRRELVASGVNWASRDEPTEPLRLQVKVRYRNPAVPALLTVEREGRVRVTFDEPQRAIARGQWAVFYDGDILVGGGVIAE